MIKIPKMFGGKASITLPKNFLPFDKKAMCEEAANELECESLAKIFSLWVAQEFIASCDLSTSLAQIEFSRIVSFAALDIAKNINKAKKLEDYKTRAALLKDIEGQIKAVKKGVAKIFKGSIREEAILKTEEIQVSFMIWAKEIKENEGSKAG